MSSDEDDFFDHEAPLPSLNARLGIPAISPSHTFSPGIRPYPSRRTSSLPPNGTPHTPLVDHVLPPPPSSGPLYSSPIRGTLEQRKEQRIKKGNKKQRATIRRRQAARDAVAAQQKKTALDDVLALMHAKGLRFNDLMEHVFDPKNQQGSVRWHDFFVVPGSATRVLNWWTSATNSAPARKEVSNWAVEFVSKTVSREARTVTRSRELQTMRKVIDASFITSFNFSDLYDKLCDMASVSIKMLTSLATSRRSQKHTPQRKLRTIMVVTSSALACLGEYSHANNLAKRILGLYLYATGSQRQSISVLSTLGLSESYTNIVSRKTYEKKSTKRAQDDIQTPVNSSSASSITPNTSSAPLETPEHAPTDEAPEAAAAAPPRRTGTLHQLSGAMRDMARATAATGLYGLVYDNINIMFRNAEQIVGRHDSQENGTCSTLFRLWKARLEDIQIKEFQQAFLTATPLDITDILHTAQEARTFKKNLVFTIMRIMVAFGGNGFQKFEKDLTEKQPISPLKIDVHQTELHPLPAWPIDESTIIGNAEVDEAIIEELRLRKDGTNFPETIRFMGGDQLSVARLRALENIRAGNEAGHAGFFWGAWMPGLFHAKIADMHGMLVTHWGQPRNPASLAFHNTRLDRLPITLTSLPPFRTCRDLVFVSLYSRVLHCLLLVSGCATLEEYITKTTSWDDLEADATEIYNRFVRTDVVDELRQQRAECGSGSITKGDMIFENAVLFMRDALISREFTDAVKAGDSGRVLLVLKIWALSFRGSGRTKYAYEMLHIIHNLTRVWPKPVRDIVLNNWLLNPTGKPNSFVEMDLVQEHLNFWIKSYYKAHGSNASWEWLELVAPCVTALRQLANGLNDLLGNDQGMRHAPPDLTEDIETLMTSLEEHKVYRIVPGRVLEDDDLPTNNIISIGLCSLMDNTKSPLTEYIHNFTRLQQRRRKQPIIIPSPTDIPTTNMAPMPAPEPAATRGAPAPGPSQSLRPETSRADDSCEVDDESDMTELALILDGLEHGESEPTLTREEAQDVALDMDRIYEVDLDDFDGLSSSEDDAGTGDEEEDSLVF
ncbi:hypothetical protein FPV67DRAFT_1711092 [Lyophyllum atratum]|nr:hypothetical protein FPV67DRAFT_1711092 [Lyophyllum atratum]